MVQVCYKLLILLYLNYKRVAYDAAGRVVSRVGVDSLTQATREVLPQVTQTPDRSQALLLHLGKNCLKLILICSLIDNALNILIVVFQAHFVYSLGYMYLVIMLALISPKKAQKLPLQCPFKTYTWQIQILLP